MGFGNSWGGGVGKMPFATKLVLGACKAIQRERN